MHAGSENIARLEHDRSKVAPDAYGDRLTLGLEFRVRGNLFLHLTGGVERIIGRREGRHDFIADGLDHGPVVVLGRGTHHVDADRDHRARPLIAQVIEQAGRADYVGKYNGEFDILDHVFDFWPGAPACPQASLHKVGAGPS